MTSLLNPNLLKQSDFVQDMYTTQSQVFSALEYPELIAMIQKYKVRSLLDVGTGEGHFIAGLAKRMPAVQMVAVEGDEKLIIEANAKSQQRNLTFWAQIFDNHFPRDRYDMIHARFAVEHMTNPICFLESAFERLYPGGILVITEYYSEFSANDDPHWQCFKSKELEMHKKVGSNLNVSLQLPQGLKRVGFENIESVFRHITPSIVGHDNFYKTVMSYILAYSGIAPDVFTNTVKTVLLDYCLRNSHPHEVEDRLLVARLFAQKPL